MDRTQAERLIAAHVKPVFGFALKRCASIQDAEDVAQEIILRAYQALLRRNDLADPVRYIWTVAHNVLANHYRDRSRMHVGIADSTHEEADFESVILEEEALHSLRQEIAALSRTQREILVAYYFHGMKQTEIAAQMALPLGTVKWHLFEAKKELKKNMETNRSVDYLSFDPIRFASFGTEGSLGDEGSPWRFFRTSLHQNIVYATWREARTVQQIAGAMGVSPVYVEDAVDYMTEQGYLTEEKGKYRCAILLTEDNARLTSLRDHMYVEAAKLIAPALHNALAESDLWSDSTFHTGVRTDLDGQTGFVQADMNFALWALIPWCIASSASEKDITFADVAVLRPDGARNIVHASIDVPNSPRPVLYSRMDGHFSGPCWNAHHGVTLWQLDTCWSARRIGEIYQHEAQANVSLLQRFFDGDTLTVEEYARLVRQGLICTQGDPEGLFKAGLTVVWLQGKSIQDKLRDLTRRVYAQHADTLTALRQPYADALLADTPDHLHKMQRYMLQNLFQSDWFIMHCLHTLVESGLLTPPTEQERRSLHTIILTE